MKETKIQTRIYDKIISNGKSLLTLFDTGAKGNYISKIALKKLDLQPQKLKYQYLAGIGGKKYKIKEYVVIEGTLHGLPLHLFLFVIDKIGTNEYGKEIDMIFGLLAMEEWGIQLDLENKKLDLSNFTKEFIEYLTTE